MYLFCFIIIIVFINKVFIYEFLTLHDTPAPFANEGHDIRLKAQGEI